MATSPIAHTIYILKTHHGYIPIAHTIYILKTHHGYIPYCTYNIYTKDSPWLHPLLHIQYIYTKDSPWLHPLLHIYEVY